MKYTYYQTEPLKGMYIDVTIDNNMGIRFNHYGYITYDHNIANSFFEIIDHNIMGHWVVITYLTKNFVL